jgi:hypothetical protein
MDMHSQAEEAWCEFYTKWKIERGFANPKHQQLTARTFEQVLKVAMVYSALAGKDLIDLDSLCRAIAVGGWIQSNTLALFSDIGLDQLGKCERIILGLLKRAKNTRMWRRDLQQVVSARGFNGEVFGRAIKALESNDRVHCFPITAASGRNRTVVEYIGEQLTGKSASNNGSTVNC